MLKRDASRSSRQLTLAFRPRGGARRGAGRKPTGANAGASHTRRPEFKQRHPLHITMKMRQGLPSLRQRAFASLVFSAFRAAKKRLGVKLVHFSVQSNHLHLIVEAEGHRALSRAMRGPRGAPGPSLECSHRSPRTRLFRSVPLANASHTVRGSASSPLRIAKSPTPRTGIVVHLRVGPILERGVLRRLQSRRAHASR